MAKSDAAVAAPVEVSEELVYDFLCLGCNQEWVQGAVKCHNCGGEMVKNILITKNG